MKKIDPVIAIILGIIVIVVIGIVVAYNASPEPNTKTYSSSDQNRPKLQIEEKDFDFGKMKVTDIKSKEIKIKNNGNEPAVLKNFTTSCNCTFIELEINGQKSPKFSMHSKEVWQKELDAGQEGTIIVSYQPSLMPVQGKVSRSAYFKTNDPENPEISINITAFIE